ncbi:unnamed protein product [Malus baccata var. baccata]
MENHVDTVRINQTSQRSRQRIRRHRNSQFIHTTECINRRIQHSISTKNFKQKATNKTKIGTVVLKTIRKCIKEAGNRSEHPVAEQQVNEGAEGLRVVVQAKGAAGPIEEAEGGNGVGLEGEEDGVEVVGLGEALASMTYVAQVTVTTITKGQLHGYRLRTCSNMTARRKMLQNSADGYSKIVDLLSRFAIHHMNVGFSRRKHGAARVDVNSASMTSLIDAIRSVYMGCQLLSLMKVDASELMYQQVLRRFAYFNAIQISEPAPLKELIVLALKEGEDPECRDDIVMTENEIEHELVAEAESAWALREWSIQHVLFPSMRFFFKPPNSMATNGAFVRVASLEKLYRTFERC